MDTLVTKLLGYGPGYILGAVMLALYVIKQRMYREMVLYVLKLSQAHMTSEEANRSTLRGITRALENVERRLETK